MICLAKVRFWTKIEFSNIVQWRWVRRDVVNSSVGSWQSPGGSSGGKALEKKIGIFTSGGLINRLK